MVTHYRGRTFPKRVTMPSGLGATFMGDTVTYGSGGRKLLTTQCAGEPTFRSLHRRLRAIYFDLLAIWGDIS